MMLLNKLHNVAANFVAGPPYSKRAVKARGSYRIRAFNPNMPDAPVRAIPTAPPLVEEDVRYSDYQSVQGVPVPFHIQLYIQGMLACDVQVSSATINTGVMIAAVN